MGRKRTYSAADIAKLKRSPGSPEDPFRYLPDHLPFVVDRETIAWIESLQPWGPFAYDPVAHMLIGEGTLSRIRAQGALLTEVRRALTVRDERLTALECRVFGHRRGC